MRLAFIAALVLLPIVSAVAAQLEIPPQFVHPHALGDDYCVSDSLLAAYDDDAQQYRYEAVDGTCLSMLNPDLRGIAAVLLLPGTCDDGKHSLGEAGVDCGGDCPAQCTQCIDPWTTTYWPISVPQGTAQQTGPRLLQLYDDELYIRAYDTLYEYADSKSVGVSSLDTSDEVLAAVAWYVDQHMAWRSDSTTNPACINVTNGLAYKPGWDFPIPASYTVRYTGVPDCTQCPDQYCGDCEDHAILRQALAKRIGVSSKCVWDAIDLNNGGKHEYNIVIYQNKYRLMDYGTIDAWLASHTTNMHETQNNWNYVYGPRLPGAGNTAGNFTHNYPLDGPLADASKVDCPAVWNLNTYYEDTCP